MIKRRCWRLMVVALALLSALPAFAVGVQAQEESEPVPLSISADCSGVVDVVFDPDSIQTGDEAWVGIYGGALQIQNSGLFPLVPGQSDYQVQFDSSTWSQYPNIRAQVSWGPETQMSTELFQCSAPEPITQPADAAEACQQGGYADWTRDDGTGFKNTGQCVKYVATGGVLEPANP